MSTLQLLRRQKMIQIFCLKRMSPLLHPVKSRLPWYNNTIHKERRSRRRLERKWHKSRLDTDEDAFLQQKNRVQTLIADAKKAYYSDKFSNASPKDMYTTIMVHHYPLFLRSPHLILTFLRVTVKFPTSNSLAKLLKRLLHVKLLVMLTTTILVISSNQLTKPTVVLRLPCSR